MNLIQKYKKILYIINTDWNSRNDVITYDLWFEHDVAFNGNLGKNKWERSTLFSKAEIDIRKEEDKQSSDQKNRDSLGCTNIDRQGKTDSPSYEVNITNDYIAHDLLVKEERHVYLPRYNHRRHWL